MTACFALEFQTAVFVSAMPCGPDRRQLPLPKSKRAWGLPHSRPEKRGRRGTPETAGLHGLVSKNKRDTRDVTTGPAKSPTSRTRCFRPYSVATPTDVPGLPFGKGPSIRRWRVFTGAIVFGTRKAPDPKTLVTRGRRAGPIRLQPPRTGCESMHGHRSRSAFQDASRNAPRGSGQKRI
jgi:hypothetical protein